MDQEIRNRLRNVVTQCRKLLEESISQELEGKYAIFAKKDQVTADSTAPMTHLNDEEQAARKDILDHLDHIKARGFKPKDALDQLIREIAFTHLNRLCAYKMMEAREVYIGGQKFREAVSRGTKSNGFMFYLAMDGHEADERLYSTGQQEIAYRHFLDWLGGLLSEEIGVLFNPNDPANRLYPKQKTLDAVLDLLNVGGIKSDEAERRTAWRTIWSEDETLGWVYQYFTPKELRDQARKESQAPRDSNELAFRNQFFTPRYVVEFLADNTLGRIWYEMQKGETGLRDQCKYMLRRPEEVFLQEGERSPKETSEESDALKSPVYIPHRPKKDPRELRILDPACGSGHFLLYCFDLLFAIYEEAYHDPDLRSALTDKPIDEFRCAIPKLILAHNLHGIDIDLRCAQLAALVLWLRCQRSYQELGLKNQRPKISRSNLVCAEPMPGEAQMVNQFVGQLEPKVLSQLVEAVFEKMKLAAEAGSLLRIEEDLREAVATAKNQWAREITQALDRKGQPLLFTEAAVAQLTDGPVQANLFDVADITDEQFFERAEGEVVKALRSFAEQAQNGHRLQWRLFTEDAVRGFAFVELCQKQYDVILMNPPFGEASLPSQPYIQATYADTKGDVYKSFVECFQDRLVPGGLLGIISSRSGFFLGQSADWRERIVLRLFRPIAVADFGQGVLDATVETAAYVLRSLNEDEDHQLTLRLLGDVNKTETDKSGFFSIPKYQKQRNGLKRHQANGELRRLLDAGFIQEIPGSFRRFQPRKEAIASAPHPKRESAKSLICIRLSSESLKQEPLLDAVRSLNSGNLPGNCFICPISDLGRIPGSPFAYWVNERVRRLFSELAPFQSEGRHACVTNPAGNDQRYFRCWWEVPSEKIGRDIRWAPMSKGGEFRRYYADIHLVVDWDEPEGTFRGFEGTVHRPLKRPASADHFFKAGLTYSSRTQLAFSARILPEGTIFHAKGPGVFVPIQDRYPILGLMNSRVFQALLKLQMAFGSYEVGVVQRTPMPHLIGPDRESLGRITRAAVDLIRTQERTMETSHLFIRPALLDVSGSSLLERVYGVERWLKECTAQQQSCQDEIDALSFRLYGFDEDDRAAIEASADIKVEDDEDDDSDDDSDESRQDVGTAGRTLVADVLSYCFGCVIGRWDVRLALDETLRADLCDPFAPLPVWSPGRLKSGDEVPLNVPPGGYPIRLEDDPIIPDDPDHADDIVRRIRDVLEVVWQGKAEAIERECVEILGVKELRDYVRKSGKGGLWDDHVNRYSKSRRKAPIYWLLQSAKRGYALWVYYPRLDKDVLFKALVNYVEPKIRLESSRLESLMSSHKEVGQSSKEGKRLAKEIERQEEFVSELRDFKERLRRAAELHLEPDLNDGVALNISPLHELVPWKEAKKSWDELMAGKYEWSSIGKQLRQKGLVK